MMLQTNLYKLVSLYLAFLLIQCRKGELVPPQQGFLYYCSRPAASGPWQVYKKNISDGTTQTITSNPAFNYWWVEPSPDHSRLLMLRSPYGSSPDQFNYKNCEMVKTNADGTNELVIIEDDENGWFAFGNPHWHPEGNRILMIAQPSTSNNPFYLYTVDTSGKDSRQLTVQWSIDGNWSPNGNKVVFTGIGTSGQVPRNFEVFAADYTYPENRLSNIRQLTNDSTRNHDACYSPDGSQIAFSAANDLVTNADLIVIDSNGLNRTAVKDDNGVHGGPLNWGTDGKIYHHSIYPGAIGFMVNAYDTRNKKDETLLASSSSGYISPYYSAK